LGHLAIQIAKASGHETIAITSRADKAEDARELGASEVLVVDAVETLGPELEARGGADIVLATTNDMKTLGSALLGLRERGRIVVAGLGMTPLALDPLELVQREAVVIGAMQGPKSELEMVLSLAARGMVTPIVETFPLHLATRALGRLVSGRARYRVVIAD
jgi:D-arabinose 1-dehydrogenase-like Zn-dependent alcohol dehydrogenase